MSSSGRQEEMKTTLWKKKRGIFAMAWMRIERGKLEEWRDMKGEAPDEHLKVNHHMFV